MVGHKLAFKCYIMGRGILYGSAQIRITKMYGATILVFIQGGVDVKFTEKSIT